VLARSDNLDYPILGEVRPALVGRVRQAVQVLAGLILFVAALEVLRLELTTVSWAELTAAFVAVPRAQVALALALTVVNYIVLTGYDAIALGVSGRTPPSTHSGRCVCARGGRSPADLSQVTRPVG